jgi:hypothetical protein
MERNCRHERKFNGQRDNKVAFSPSHPMIC